MSDRSIALVWFRRDLRDHDHAALYHALRAHRRVYCAFVFDSEILDALPARSDRRVGFIHASVLELDAALRERGGGLIVRHGVAREEIPALADALGAAAVYANRDYEPLARARDAAVAQALAEQGRALHLSKDQVIFEGAELLTQAGKPFGVFTPYKNAWLRKVDDFYLRSYPVARYADRLARPPEQDLPALAQIGFDAGNLAQLAILPGMRGAQAAWADFQPRLERYAELRDFPAAKGVSYLSVHLRFGTLSIRELARHAHYAGGRGAESWRNELIWREFYQQVLWHRPDVVTHAWRRELESIPWLEGEAAAPLLDAWREARTGYPIVDAAMRQLAQSGYMHNRLRMITASFLTKDLGVHWREGERHFAALLNDYDLAANNGGWQWCASTGCDAQPYFRIFNPVSQSRKFDPDGRFIRRYLPELAALPDTAVHAPWALSPVELAGYGVRLGRDYPAPVVDHAAARAATLARFQAGAGNQAPPV